MESKAQIEWVIENLTDEEITNLATYTLKKTEVKSSDVLNTYAAIKANYIYDKERLKDARKKRERAEEREIFGYR